MAKIEEVTALLMDEISSFEKSVDLLKKQTEVIKNHKIDVDTLELDSLFKKFENKLNTNYQLENNQLKEIQSKLNKTAIIPNWMAILFSLLFIVSIFSFGFNFYLYQKNKETEKTAYSNGINDMKKHLQLYFSKNPKTYKHYQKWEKNQ